MDLLCNIRNDRARLRSKQPLERKAFNTVSCIVKKYGLAESFLELLDRTDKLPAKGSLELNRIKAKEELKIPPFCLLSQQEYHVAVAIASKLDNPYLPHACSAEELLLCKALYEANPLLNSTQLSRYHFETLLQCQLAKEELVRLEREACDSRGAPGHDAGVGQVGGHAPSWSSLQEHIKQLRTFVANIESTGS